MPGSTSCSICRAHKVPAIVAIERMYGMKDRFSYARCDGCGCLSIEDPPQDLGRFYPEERYYSLEHLGVHLLDPPGLRRWFKHRRNEAQLFGRPAWARPLVRWRRCTYTDRVSGWFLHADRRAGLGLRVLDVGCGSGALLAQFSLVGFRTLDGIDPHLGTERDHLGPVRLERKRLQDLDGRKYDLIILNHSLEHMPDQVEALTQVRGLLAPNGLARIEVPVADCIAFERYGVNWVDLDAPRHFFLHTRDSLKRLAERCGLEVVEERDVGHPFEFWGSEMYARGLTLYDLEAGRYRRAEDAFSDVEIRRFEAESAAAREQNRGGRVLLFVRASRKAVK